MSTLKWEDVPTKASAKPQMQSSNANPWFAVTVGLIGVIVGYVLANLLH